MYVYIYIYIYIYIETVRRSPKKVGSKCILSSLNPESSTLNPSALNPKPWFLKVPVIPRTLEIPKVGRLTSYPNPKALNSSKALHRV